MKRLFPRQFCVLVLLVVFVSASGAAVQAKGRHGRSLNGRSGRAKTVTASGCVKAGVEAGCLVLTDPRTDVLYQLSFKGNKPPVGMAIRFTGTAHGGITICMQGIGISVKRWARIKMRCRRE